MRLSEISVDVARFVKEKGWDQKDSKKPQTPKNLAISIVLESAELLECFQWQENSKVQNIEEEMADILIYLSQLANVLNIDFEEAVKRKLQANYKREWK